MCVCALTRTVSSYCGSYLIVLLAVHVHQTGTPYGSPCNTRVGPLETKRVKPLNYGVLTTVVSGIFFEELSPRVVRASRLLPARDF